MNTKKLVHMGVVAAACILVAGGCKKTGAGRDGQGALNDGFTRGAAGDTVDMTELEMDTRFPEGTPYGAEGQFPPVYFDYDSASLSAGERFKAETVAEEMRLNPQLQVTLFGHCDERGSREYNMALGENRALAVRQYLLEMGVDSGRIQTISYGEEDPAVLGHTEEDYRYNRRVEFGLAQP